MEGLVTMERLVGRGRERPRIGLIARISRPPQGNTVAESPMNETQPVDPFQEAENRGTGPPFWGAGEGVRSGVAGLIRRAGRMRHPNRTRNE
jgi:hypothetical protein